MSTLFDTIDTLDEFKMIGGTNVTLVFLIYDQNGSPINLSDGGGSAKWVMCYYGQFDDPILVKTGVIDPIITNQMTVILTTTDTKLISGKFIQQPVVVDFAGEEYRPAQGIFTIVPRVPLV